MHPSIYLRLAGLSGLLAVAFGAFGAHALKDALAQTGHAAAWQTAVLYHLAHTLALWGAAVAALSGAMRGGGRWLRAAAICWTAGILLFSGSLYALALGGPRWLGPITPLGGGFFIAGWISVLVGGFAAKERNSSPQ